MKKSSSTALHLPMELIQSFEISTSSRLGQSTASQNNHATGMLWIVDCQVLADEQHHFAMPEQFGGPSC